MFRIKHTFELESTFSIGRRKQLFFGSIIANKGNMEKRPMVTQLLKHSLRYFKYLKIFPVRSKLTYLVLIKKLNAKYCMT